MSIHKKYVFVDGQWEKLYGGSGGGGGGESYIAGENIRIQGNVISAKDTTYTAGDGIEITNANVIKNLIDISNYYNKTEIQDLLNAMGNLTMQIVAQLPTAGASNVIYLVKRPNINIYDQWIYQNYEWANIGDTSVDLSQYYTKTQMDTILSTNHYTKTEADDKFQEQLFQTPELVNVTDTVPLCNVTVADKTVTPIKAQYIWRYIKSKITGAISNIVDTDLTASKVLVSNGDGKVTASTVDSNFLTYLTDLPLSEGSGNGAIVYPSSASAGYTITGEYSSSMPRRAFKKGGVVNISMHCTGTAVANGANWTTVGTVASGFRPKYQIPIVAMVYNGNSYNNEAAGGHIKTDGSIVIWTNAKSPTNNYQVRVNATYLAA